MSVRILTGDALAMLRTLPDDSVHMCVTSPPYFNLRDYEVEGQIGLEPNLEEHLAVMVGVFREVRRVLRPDGSLWLNYGDAYAGSWSGNSIRPDGGKQRSGGPGFQPLDDGRYPAKGGKTHGLKPKDLMMIPNRLALALQADGWWVRSEIVWGKPNPMPDSSGRYRPSTAHEKIFLLSKTGRMFYDAEAMRLPAVESSLNRWSQDVDGQAESSRAHAGGRANGAMKAVGGPQKVPAGWDTGPGRHGAYRRSDKQRGHSRRHAGFNDRWDAMSREEQQANGRYLRNWEPDPFQVWKIATAGYKEAHFATFPPSLVAPCIRTGTSDHGCCPHCGAPWLRLVERGLAPTGKAARRNVVDSRDGAADRNDQGANRQKDGHMPGWCQSNRTLGWAPSCACPEHEPVPATVLDPFFGSGTTGMVADRLTRNCIGIELNPKYADMARRRIKRDGGLFAEVAAE